MYNRYIGNSGKFYRVDDDEISHEEKQQKGEHFEQKNSIHHILPGIFENGNPMTGLKSMLNGLLPEGTDIGDLLLILVLLLIYLEKEDEETLIILSVLIFMGFN